MNEEINNKLQRGLALTVKESWELYKYIKALEQTELNSSYNGVKTELKPCEDYISRQRVLNDLENVTKGSEHPRQVFVFVDECVDYITSVPSVTPKAEWIPCSERLPEREGWYLTSLGDKTYGGADVDMYCKGWVKYGTHVLAWMPLPPCYEPQESEDEE